MVKKVKTENMMLKFTEKEFSELILINISVKLKVTLMLIKNNSLNGMNA